jgi:hypothetical protein
VIKKTDPTANTVTIDAAGAELIDASATYVLTLPYKYVEIVASPPKWHIIGNN